MNTDSVFSRAALTVGMRLFGLFKMPIIAFISPRLIELSDESVVIRIPLVHRTKNHLRTMHLGVLASAADFTVGVLVMGAIKKSGAKVSMVFKSFHADFKKRVDGNAHFKCNQGRQIAQLIAEAVNTGERQELPVNVEVTVPAKSDEVAANFSLILSVKRK